MRASTTGMLYVLDEPSVGLHPSNVAGLRKTLTALAGNGIPWSWWSTNGKTAPVLDSLIPAARAMLGGSPPPGHVRRLDLNGIRQVVQVDASPIGQNARSRPATYSGAFDQIRRVFAESAYARRRRWKPSTWARAAARTAATSSPRGRPKT